LGKLPGIKKVFVKYKKGLLFAEYNGEAINESKILKHILNEGYGARKAKDAKWPKS